MMLTCTETVQGNAARHALKPCMFFGECDAHHARVGVQHKRPIPCTTAVQRTLHGFSATQDNPYRTTNPVMHCVQDGRKTYRNFSTTTVDLPDHRGNNRPRARMEVA